MDASEATEVNYIYKGDVDMNIMDGMDAARFNSGNPTQKAKRRRMKGKEMPMVLRNLNNK